MRLICPGCGAQYEVETAAIPHPGRDVQCAECQTYWFQVSEAEPDSAAEASGLSGPVAEAEVAAERAAPEPPVADELSEPPPAPSGAQASPEPEPAASTPPRPQIDPSLLALLREEAERELQARREEGSLLENQAELGLPEPPPAVAPPPAPDLVAERAARRAQLPDIDDIKSSLRAEAPPSVASHELEMRNSSGFRRGFLTMMVLLIALAALYLFAPLIAEKVPTLAGPLGAFKGGVDQLRLLVQGLVGRV